MFGIAKCPAKPFYAVLGGGVDMMKKTFSRQPYYRWLREGQ
jgi:hypothetical protein